MGIQRQLVFPSFGFSALLMAIGDDDVLESVFRVDSGGFDRSAVSAAAMDAHNDWVLRSTRIDRDRIRPVAVLKADSPEDLVTKADHLISHGARAIWLPAAVPPGGVSPADVRLDGLWARCQEADVAVVLHLGTQSAFQKSPVWGRAPEFASTEQTSSIEFSFDSYTAATLHLQMENFLTVMVFGGVFERFSGLRFGVIESGAQWFGPLADRLDLWAGPLGDRMSRVLSMRPSEYLARNVRITPFVFERIETYLAAYPHLVDSYCYSSDYPHVEGGRDSARLLYERVSPLGEDVVRKFFIDNAAWLVAA